MAKKDTVTLRFRIESIAPQRQQYRPYLFNLLPENTFLDIEVPAGGMIQDDGDFTVLNLEGFKAMLSSVADAVDEVHDAYVIKARKAGKF